MPLDIDFSPDAAVMNCLRRRFKEGSAASYSLIRCSVQCDRPPALVLKCSDLAGLAELSSLKNAASLISAAVEMGFSTIEYSFNNKIINTMTQDLLHLLIPKDISSSLHALDAWVTNHSEAVVFVMEGTFMTCSQE